MADDKIAHRAEGDHADGQVETTKTAGGVLSIQLPPDPLIWAEARRLVADKNVRVEDLATCASQDPVLVIELLKTANAMYFSGGRPPITATKTAIVRLGSDVVLELLDNINKRPPIDDEDVLHWLEIHRSRCKRAAIIARMIAEVVIKNFSDECQAAGLMSFTGEMLAVAQLRENYVKLGEELSRSAINYRLAQDYRFDVEKMGLNYLRRNGIPEVLLFALDRDALSRTPERAQMKPTVMAAGEMVDAFDSNRWDKLAPGKTIPSKSHIRLLQINDQQYLKLYERASEYLFSIRLLEEKKKQQSFQGLTSPESLSVTEEPIHQKPAEDGSLESDIQALINAAPAEDVRVPPPAVPPRPATVTPPKAGMIAPPGAPSERAEKFGFSNLGVGLRPPRRKSSERQAPVEPRKLASPVSTKVVGEFTQMFEKVDSSEQLLENLLGMLIKPGLFEKSALIVVSKDRKNAIVVAARGPSIGNGQTLIIDDPLSPLAECFSKVQSFGNKESKASPFGSKAFALAPIDVAHDTPVALYADCGNDGSLTFESRRIFRTVVDILNEKLPLLPGGLPVELEAEPE